jgi:hypothetical protein
MSHTTGGIASPDADGLADGGLGGMGGLGTVEGVIWAGTAMVSLRFPM